MGGAGAGGWSRRRPSTGVRNDCYSCVASGVESLRVQKLGFFTRGTRHVERNARAVGDGGCTLTTTDLKRTAARLNGSGSR